MSNEARKELDELPGIKESELNEMGPCAVCHKPLLDREAGHILFYRVSIERCGWDVQAVQQQAGLAMMLGGHTRLAHVMGPDRDLAKVIDGPRTVAVHNGCGDRVDLVMLLLGGDRD